MTASTNSFFDMSKTTFVCIYVFLELEQNLIYLMTQLRRKNCSRQLNSKL